MKEGQGRGDRDSGQVHGEALRERKQGYEEENSRLARADLACAELLDPCCVDPAFTLCTCP